ncbi:nuclear pore complex protein Nup153 isoform X2 [Pseudophryne corroboree]|uniref:nuclear pore complex protein Nup153 isoform X2 n=1 Tax=Pseudophryne corroboree TaxID=495146 RepID=UPI003081F4D8
MAAEGGGTGTGGRIRSRRYHVSAGRTPYSRHRQQGRQGIISRVTDTVKSIVPAWLQKYFNKDDEVPGRSRSTNEVEEHMENRENDVDNHIYEEEDGPSSADGRVTPEPVRIQEDPSTSQFTLNVPDTLTRPSLHRPNLNVNLLDSPARHCQPSTSSSFPIGPSQFSLVKEIKDSTYHEDDNISTTSGFSSRASEKDVVIKSVTAPPLWSPEADRIHNLSHNSSMNSKKPTFNLSAFSALSPSLGNTSVSKPSFLGDSPFYPGKTTYGGAAASRVSKVRSTPYQAPVRRQVKAKPANSQSYGVTSSTARRILQSLEKMSSPLSDARRIPSISTPVSLVDSTNPPVQRLVTPKCISVSTNMSLYIKPSLPSSATNTSNRRAQSSGKHKESRKNDIPDAPLPQLVDSPSYPRFSTPASNGFHPGKGGGKMMREKGSHYTTKPSDEEVEIPDLPEVPLPLSMTALPIISLCAKPATTLPPVTASTFFSTPRATNSTQNPEFTFSSPIVKSTESNAQSPELSVGFTFSAPALIGTSFPSPTNTTSAITSPAKAPVVVNNKTAEEHGGFCKPAKTLKEGSVLDILRSPGFSSVSSKQTASTKTSTKSTSPIAKPAATLGESNKQALGIWYCTCCLLENKASDGNCVACRTAKDLPAIVTKQSVTTAPSTPVKNTTPLTSMQGFGDKFKVAAGTWDCDTCLVPNKPESTKCVACENPKPGTGPKAALLLFPTTKSDKPVVPTSIQTASPSLKFEELARKPIGSWECTVCLVQNKAEVSSCACCTSPKSGMSAPMMPTSLQASLPSTQGQLGLLDKFKQPAGSWNCDTCLVQNKAEAVKCVSCTTAKSGTKAELTGFGLPSISSETTLPTVKFGFPSSNDSGELKSIASTGSSNITAGGFSFPKFPGEIKFGIDSSKSADEKKDTGLTFSSQTTTNNPVPTTFKFGFSNSSTEKESTVKPLTQNFTFGTVPSTAPNAESSGSTNLVAQLAKEKPNVTASFGLKEPGDKKNETLVVSGFTFGKVEQTEAATTFAFGKNDEKTDSTTTGTTIFGSKNEGEQTKKFVFGKADASASASFSFGVPNAADKKETDQTTKPVFTFGLPPKAADNEAPKPAFSFQGNGASAATQSSTVGSSGIVFGNVSQPSTQTSSSSVFGSAIKANSTSGGFGTAAPVCAPAPSASIPPASVAASSSTGFSSSTSLPAPTGSNNVFGSAAPLNSSVLFGSASVSSTPTSSNNVFGTAAPVSTATSSNMFGSGAPTSTSASSNSLFGNSSAPTNSSTGPFVFGQPTTTASSSLFGSANESKSNFVFSGQESKVTVTSASAAPATVTPFVFGANVPSATPAPPSFNFTATNTSNVTGTNSTPFIFGAGAAAPAASVLAAANPVSVFGKSASQTNTPTFGSSSSSSLFPASSQPAPAFGSLTNNVQNPPVFGQQSTQPAFGSSIAPSGGPGFQFGNQNFNFTPANAPGVFTFGSNPGATQAPTANSGFVFNQHPTFNMGTNGRTVTPSSISTRKIKTARRRK